MKGITINIVAAHDSNHGIGKDNDLLWPPGSQRADMARFRELTTGHPVIMGRKTWESIPEKYRPLPGRLNMVISRNEDYKNQGGMTGCMVYKCVEDAVAYCNYLLRNEGRNASEYAMQDAYDFSQVWIAGGGQIYNAALSSAHLMVHNLYLTEIKHKYDSVDCYLPEHTDFVIKSYERFPADEKNKHPYTFLHMVRSSVLDG